MSTDDDAARERSYEIHDRWFAGEARDPAEQREHDRIEGQLFSPTHTPELDPERAARALKARSPQARQGRTRNNEHLDQRALFQVRDPRGRFVPAVSRGRQR